MNWVSIKDKLPENTDDVLICNRDPCGDYHSYAVAYYSTRKRWEVSEDMLAAKNHDGGASIYLNDTVTHWAEIEPPKEK